MAGEVALTEADQIRTDRDELLEALTRIDIIRKEQARLAMELGLWLQIIKSNTRPEQDRRKDVAQTLRGLARVQAQMAQAEQDAEQDIAECDKRLGPRVAAEEGQK